MSRNKEIELWRFFIALMIVNFHSVMLGAGAPMFTYGNIGVEFFFALSGYLLAGSALKVRCKNSPLTWGEIHQETTSLLLRRIKAFFPETFIACLMTCAFYTVFIHPPFAQLLRASISTMFGDACFLSMTGLFGKEGLNFATWYLSSLLICSAFLYVVILRWGISPLYFIIGWLLLGGVYIHGNAVDLPGVYEPCGIFRQGNIRACATMLIGISLYPLGQKMKQTPVSKAVSVGLMLVKWCSFIFFIVYANNASFMGHNVGLVLVAFCAMIVLIFSEKCYDSSLYKHPFILFLGKFSLPLYLSHSVYSLYLRRTLPSETSDYVVVILYYLVSFITAFAVMEMAKRVRNYSSK